MKHRFYPRWLALGSVLLGVGFAAGRADGAEQKKGEVSRTEAENLQRYDRNANGKLDPDEIAAMKADEAREKSREQSKERDKEKEKAPRKKG